jgi:hypothetical protein
MRILMNGTTIVVNNEGERQAAIDTHFNAKEYRYEKRNQRRPVKGIY